MKIEKSCGAIVFTREHGEIQYVIIRSTEGYYGFPKGHMEGDETEQETALREIKEETGLDVTLIGDFRTTDEHALVREGRPDVTKQIVYFLAEYKGQELQAQLSEISEIQLMGYDQAMEAFQFESSKRLLQEAAEYLKTYTDFTIKEMLALQGRLQEKYKDKWEPIAPETGKNKLLWMIGEIGEVIDIVKKNGGQKATKDSEIRSRLVEEMADVLMYYNDVMLCYGITAGELKRAYVAKFERNMKRW